MGILTVLSTILRDSKSNPNKKVAPNKQKQNVPSTESSLKATSSPQTEKCKTATSTPTQDKVRMGLRYERRNSINGRKESSTTTNRRRSIGNVSGIMSSLAKIRQNMLESPHFLLKKEDKLNQNYIVLSENQGLGKNVTPQFPQLKKAGKENTEK